MPPYYFIIDVIADNLSTHKGNTDWLTAHSNVTLYLRPRRRIGSIRLKYDFRILQREVLRGASFESIGKLAQAIKYFTAVYYINTLPFIWRKCEVNRTQLRNTIFNLYN